MAEAVTFASDQIELAVLPHLGCRLHRLRAFGDDLLRTPPDPTTHADDPFFWGAYVMAPWTNRASARPMTIAGRRVELRTNFADGTAIHGQVYAAPWRRVGDAEFAVDHAADEAWPWDYTVGATFTLDGPRLQCEYRLANASSSPMPGGLGLHAWLVGPVGIALRARAVHPANGDADAGEVATEGRWALEGDVPPVGTDATWLGLDPRQIHLRWPETGTTAVVRATTSGPEMHAAVAHPQTPAATAVEPVTHRPWGLDRLARGEGQAMDVLGPGAALVLRLDWEFTGRAA